MGEEKQKRFWNREYGLICLCNFLLCASIFLQFPLFGQWAAENDKLSGHTFVCAALFAVGMFISGPFNAFWVDRFRRKRVCGVAILGLVVTSVGMTTVRTLWELGALRLIEGGCFGILQMAMGGTLINDLSVSSKRTLTDSFYLWFARLSFAPAIAAAWYLSEMYGLDGAFEASVMLQLVALLVLGTVKVSFHAPTHVSLISLDRFWHPRALMLVLNLLPVMVVQGMLLGGNIPPEFIGMLAMGLLIAFVTHRTFFEEADYRADAVAGLLLMMGSSLLLLLQDEPRVLYFAFTLLGIGLGWFNSRFFLYFLKLSGHCQRGTLQQTYILTSMLGLCMGFVLTGLNINQYFWALILSAFSLLMYLFIVHPWFQRNKDRNFKFREV